MGAAMQDIDVKDKARPKGMVELFVTRGRPELVLYDKILNKHGLPLCKHCDILFDNCDILDVSKQHNILVNRGKDAVITSLTTGFVNTLARLAVGDNGTLPSDSTVAKTPVATMTALYNEVGRADAEATVLNVGSANTHEVKLIKTFSAADFPIVAFFNQAKPVINEIGLIMIDLAAAPLPRVDNYGPYTLDNQPLADEVLFAIRTHKSVPFEASNDISLTVRYTIYVE